MDLETFHVFPLLPSEARIRVWQYAYMNEDPRVVEICLCSVDHAKGKCYATNSHLRPNECCYHLESPFESPPDIPCRCLVAHQLRRQRDAKSGKGRSNVQRGVIDSDSFPSVGHYAQGTIHWCPTKLASISPLLSTNSESRYEVQLMGGVLENVYPGHLHTPRDTESLPKIYFNFASDALVISEPMMKELAKPLPLHDLKGLERVKSLLIFYSKYPAFYQIPPSAYSISEREAEVLVQDLSRYPAVETMFVAKKNFDAGREATIEVLGADSMEPGWFQYAFFDMRIVKDFFNDERERQGLSIISRLEWVRVGRRSLAGLTLA
ncbi:hypothetical protein EG329_000859 [Mollisiaceae sp. DMI_Dod_QoI]|nr:hypothetical protein EG329_000859 [Helotiales sp. DMI_Dod_QoI]